VLADLADKTILLGVINLSDHAIEPVEVVADRVRRAFPFKDPGSLVIATDCGMKYLPREAAEGKMAAMAGAAAILREEIQG
jgi:5-methyltetrahydropteroyltriglutamate--homocysteine methyltransferase